MTSIGVEYSKSSAATGSLGDGGAASICLVLPQPMAGHAELALRSEAVRTPQQLRLNYRTCP